MSEQRIINAEGFNQFWACYPRRVGRLAAIKVWNRLKPDAALVRTMLEAIGWQRATKQWHQGYVPHPTTWLAQGRWLDEPEEKLTRPAHVCPHDPPCTDGTWRCVQRTELDAARKAR